VSKQVILCIDDNLQGLEVRRMFLEAVGYDVLCASSAREGLGLLAFRRVDLIVLDYQMPEMNGEWAAREIRKRFPGLPIVMLTGYFTEVPVTARQFVEAIITKGSSAGDLLQEVERLLGTRGAPGRSRQEVIDAGKKAIQQVKTHLAEQAKVPKRHTKGRR
jgi:CheY-like chemotaxis protein